MYPVHKIRPIVTDVTCSGGLCVCMYCAETTELIEILAAFKWWPSVTLNFWNSRF